jgi:hypothetical protein
VHGLPRSVSIGPCQTMAIRPSGLREEGLVLCSSCGVRVAAVVKGNKRCCGTSTAHNISSSFF